MPGGSSTGGGFTGQYMHSFKDNAGRAWNLEINVLVCQQLKAAHGFDVYALLDDGMKKLAELVSNPVHLAEVLCTLIKGQLAALGVTPEQFFAALAGDVLDAAAQAFVDEVLDFFPERATRQIHKKAILKAKELQAVMVSRAEKELESLDLEDTARKLSGQSTASPGSAVLTPTP